MKAEGEAPFTEAIERLIGKGKYGRLAKMRRSRTNDDEQRFLLCMMSDVGVTIGSA